MPSWVSTYKWLIITAAALAIAAAVAIGWHSIFKGGETAAKLQQSTAQLEQNKKDLHDYAKIHKTVPHRADRAVKLEWLSQHTGSGQ